MTTAPNQRLLSLDTLRGFDMFWIVGGGVICTKLAELTDWAWADALAKQMHHAKWGHFHFFDLVFPLFILMAGVAIPYALFSKLEKGESKKQIHLKILKRFAILAILGIVYNGGLQFQWETLRIPSVLGLIGGAYAIGACIAINFRSAKAVAAWCFGILAAYAVLQLWIPVPGQGAGILTGEGSWNGYIDRMFLPDHLLGKTMDPEGILCVVASSSLTLMGVWAGLLLRRDDMQPYRKTAIISLGGLGMLLAALVLRQWYPIIKALSTAPYLLFAGGLSLLLLALFHLVVDVWKFQRWTFFFRVIGMNSITIYMGTKIIPFWHSASFLFGGIAGLFGEFKPLVLSIGVVTLEWLFLYFLYRKKIFLKI